MAGLLQSLRWTGAVAHVDVDNSGSGSGSDSLITAAGAKDGSDATFHSLILLDDSGAPLSADALTIVTAALDAYIAVGAIQFVRIKVRARGFKDVGAGPINVSVSFYIGGNSTPITGLSATPSFTDFTIDMPNNPLTTQPWLASAFTSTQIGLILGGNNLDPAFSTVSHAQFSEFTFEVWGDAPPVVSVKSALGSDIMLSAGSGQVDTLEQFSGVVDKEVASGTPIEGAELVRFGDVIDKAAATGVVED